ncbi:hypothetical protein NMY22_g9544 [Coprinellus aureogranulatus]|nr:hypothetical protein NMY22_g9544 [Coprinellus aureogranulatus]
MSLRSKYSHLLDSNQPLDPAILLQLSQRRDSVRAEIKRLQEEEQICTTLLSPQRRLPPEILGEIFLLVTPGILDKVGREIVVNMGLVSKHWRSAALCAHRLWNRVSISPALQHKAYDKIVGWLSRSGNAPKALEYDAWSHLCTKSCNGENPLLHKLLLEGPPLKHLKLKIVQVGCFRDFLWSISDVDTMWKSHTWDSLESLHLKFMDYSRARTESDGPQADVHDSYGGWLESARSCGSLFQHIPSNATTFRLDLPAVDCTFPFRSRSREAGLRIQPDILGRFTTLTIRCDWEGDHLINILKHCTHLRTLTLDLNRRPIYSSREQQRAPVTLPHVRRLRFRNAANIMFLLGIKTPALQELDLEWSRGGRGRRPVLPVSPEIPSWVGEC